MLNHLNLIASTFNPLNKNDDIYLKEAGISEGLRKNGSFRSISGFAIYDYLCYSDKIKRLNTGRLPSWLLKKYESVEKGAIVFRSLDPDLNWSDWMDWSRLRPHTPRFEEKEGKIKGIKYESPYGVQNRVTYFLISMSEWRKIGQRYHVDLPDEVRDWVDDAPAIGFWEWVERNTKIPIVLTEGEKKAAYLLTQGFVAIGLPGIWNGRVGKDGIEIVHPDLRRLCRNNRRVIVCFDYETKIKTRWAVFLSTLRLARCLKDAGCEPRVAMLPGEEKGVDDWGLAKGEFAEDNLRALFNDALPIALYQQVACPNSEELQRFKPDLTVDAQYLSTVVELPESGVVALKSEMGTGKTELLKQWREQYPEERFLNCGHRVNLLKNLSNRLGTKLYLEALNLKAENALSITVDSLYKIGEGLQYGCLFIDEACQYMAHLLTSSTCKAFRAQILEILESLVHRAKLVVLADAHLDDLTIGFFMAMRPEGEKPFVVENKYKVPARMIYFYEGNDPSMLVDTLKTEVSLGRKCLVVSDSKRFVKKTERMLIDEQPELRVWSIHSENSGSEENCYFISNIKEEVKTIDILITSPSLGTGVDISDYHFDSTFGVFMDVNQTATECAQQMWRYRPNVELHIWVAPQPPFGYREIDTDHIKENILNSNEIAAFNLRIDKETGRRGIEKEWALDAYCQLQSQRNRSTNNLRGDLYRLLGKMGHYMNRLGDETDPMQQLRLQEVGMLLKEEYCLGVANAKDITWQEYEARSQMDYLSPQEKLEYEKFRIKKFYGMKVTPELVDLDDEGRFTKRIIALEESLEEGLQEGNHLYPGALVSERDKKEREDFKISWDWKNACLRWLARANIGLLSLLHDLINGESIAATDERVTRLNQKALDAYAPMKQLLNITINKKSLKGFWLIGQLLDQLGLKLDYRKLGSFGHQIVHATLSPEEWRFAQHVLSHRQHEREEARQKKAQKEAELEQLKVQMERVTEAMNPISIPPENLDLVDRGGGIDMSDAKEELSNNPYGEGESKG